MDKRYQVFISSTYVDLLEARAAVSEALLRASCFPAGMELFPAADAEQFEFIKGVIDASDYYLIISAGRYGSVSPETKLSYTEMEYDYAVHRNKPIIRLLHRDPLNRLTGDRIEQGDEGRTRLAAFRKKMMEGRLVSLWEDTQALKAETVFALQDIQRRHPAVGWVRGDTALDAGEALEIARMRKRLSQLEEAERQRKAEEAGTAPLDWRLPTAEKTLIHLKGDEDLHLLVDALFDVERFLHQGLNTRDELSSELVSDHGLDKEAAEGLVDALFVDRFITMKGRLVSMTATGEMVLSKIRLQGLGVAQDAPG